MSVRCYHVGGERNPFRVRYAETDQMGVVYHANYLVWMEMGRVELAGRKEFVIATWNSKKAYSPTLVAAALPLSCARALRRRGNGRNECEALDVTCDRVRIPDDILGNRRQTRDRLDYARLLQSCNCARVGSRESTGRRSV